MGAGPEGGHFGGGTASALGPGAATHAGRGDTWAKGHAGHSGGGMAPEQPHVLEGGGAQERRGMCAQEEGRECVWRGTREGGRAQERVAPRVPTWEGQAGKGGTPDGLVHQAWRAYLIAHPWHRGPHRCDGVYPLQCQCSDPLIRSPRGDDVWGRVSPPFAQPSLSTIFD